MIIIFGANGTLGDEICSSLINGKKDIILCANSGFSELEKKYVDEKYVKHILKCDVEKIINIEEIFNFLSKNNIKLSAVINNFAFTFQESISEREIEKERKIFNINYFGFSEIMENLVELTDDNYKTRVRVVNVLSNSLKTLNASNKHYIASKAAVEKLSNFYSKKFARRFSINCVCPGLMKSRLTEERFAKDINKIEQLTPSKKLATPNEVASVISYLANDCPFSVTGQTIYIDGGRTL